MHWQEKLHMPLLLMIGRSEMTWKTNFPSPVSCLFQSSQFVVFWLIIGNVSGIGIEMLAHSNYYIRFCNPMSTIGEVKHKFSEQIMSSNQKVCNAHLRKT